MIQEIAPHQFDRSYPGRDPEPQDYVVCLWEGQIFLLQSGDQLTLPTLSQWGTGSPLVYGFAIDRRAFFLTSSAPVSSHPQGQFYPLSTLRNLAPQWMAFGAITGCQLLRWRASRRYCGRCGTPMEDHPAERALCCPHCHLVESPKISPAVIVAVTNGDRILLAKAAHGSYPHWALIAGFVEIGETFEETVAREVREEVGLQVCNIRYYKSQPWAFSDTEMIGFYADLDGPDTITLQKSELAQAQWFPRQEIPPSVSSASIGNELIETFRANRHPK